MPPAASRPAPAPEAIRLRGVRQNNLKGFDLDVPLGRYVVVTGLSGAGKSSLVFDTLHAEGQRRYVETFSAYTRQFLDLLDKPKVDSVENIRPSIAISQTNTVKTSRSTVGTMTELTDYFKVWFSHVAGCFDPETGEPVEDDSPATIWAKTSAAHAAETLLLCFRITKPDNLTWPEILTSLKGQGYTRVLLGHANAPSQQPEPKSDLALHKIEDLLAAPKSQSLDSSSSAVFVIQDRLRLAAENKSRFLEATETALHFGKGEVHLFAPQNRDEWRASSADASRAASTPQRETPLKSEISDLQFTPAGHFSRGLHSPKTGRTFRPASPGLFSFNSPLGACPKCRGFGRVIDIDYRLAIPDHSLSIEAGAIKAWEGEVYGESKKDLLQFTKKLGIPTNVPFARLTPEQQTFVIEGSPGYDSDNPAKNWPKLWYGLKGFFRYLEKTTYKMHVRVFLSRFRSYNPCPDCHGTRLQPESLCWKWQGHTLPELYQLPVSQLLALVQSHGGGVPPPRENAATHHQRDLAYDSIVTRLRYLEQVGLGYLTLDRSSRTLSGGEVQRVNLTSCLGTSLVDTLFVLDEPSVGLHPRDINRLLGIIRTLTDTGNTVVVVEHDEAMIRAADHVIEIGPEPGARGGEVVFQGTVPQMLRSAPSITGAYFSGRQDIPTPAHRRPVEGPAPAGPRVKPKSTAPWLTFTNASKHNICNLTFSLPLQRLVCLSGVSGSGKSTLLDHVIHQGLLAHRNQMTEDPASIEAITGDQAFPEIVLVDQSPLSRTPRSNAALYCEAWDFIRELYAQTPAAQEAGFSASSFSFNSGEGRCDHCQGLGSERVEMQFLSDVFVPCPICEGRRFKPEVLAIRWHGKSIDDLLRTTITDAIAFFAPQNRSEIARDTPAALESIRTRFASLEAVGLGYLPLGQPLNTLSGGESQRLKLVRYLSDYTGADPQLSNLKSEIQGGALLLLDEPTTGLHRHDVQRLLEVLQRIVDRGHSVIVIEHNLDVLKSADWILEVGPEAGSGGGRIVAEGPPELIAQADTATSPFLRDALNCRAGSPNPAFDLQAAEDPAPYRTGLVMNTSELNVIGARENNLKNISVSIPHRQLSVVTGVSGSGKSTLAFDIIFAEGQRRFMESMSPYARQFVEQLPRPDIDRLTGIPPTVAIEQRITRGSRKSTVATITEVAQYLRLLYARAGVQHHPESGRPVTPLSPSQLRALLTKTLATPPAKKAKHLYLCAPLVRGRKGHHEPIAKWIEKQGYALMRADGRLLRTDTFQKLDRYKEHDIEVVIADLKNPANPKWLHEQLATALRLGKGSCFIALPSGAVLGWFSTTRTDIASGESFPELDPKQFSFNSPRGWCPTCRGHGRIYDWMLQPDEDDERSDEVADALRAFDPDDPASHGSACPTCHGERLNRIARAVRLPLRANLKSEISNFKSTISLPELLRLVPGELIATLRGLQLDARTKLITQDIVPQIEERLKFLGHVGLDYLSLERPTETLSGGEAQRIRLAAQLGSNLSGVLYVLDEPSIGLHARDNDRLIDTLQSLRAKGNTLLVVEHDDVLMARADRIIDLGPGAGVHGGSILANGTPAEIKASDTSLTGLFLAKGIKHPLRGSYRPLSNLKSDISNSLTLTSINYRNLQDQSLRLPPGRLIMACGPSGAGKSTLFRDILHPAVTCAIKHRKAKLTGKEFVKLAKFDADGGAATSPRTPARGRGRPRPSVEPFATLTGANVFKSVIEVDQAPIGKTPRSTPATYLGIFDLIRQFFATLPEAKMRGYTAGRFSFNTAGGRCETCSGAGRIKLEMAFMADSYLPCDACGGSRFGPELADIAWKGKTIGQVLQLTFDEAAAFFDFHSQLSQVCQLMIDCGLGYLTLGQSSPTLSGGEAQRLKLVTELTKGLQSYQERSRNITIRNLYLLEEPTIGLHLSDCEKLIKVLHNLVDQGHTVVVIEHHLDLLAEADYILELGPGGGPRGGEILYQGELAGLLKVKRSPTAPYLREKLGQAGL
ncbi:UvrABC system protein A [Lacunisphaera limnophila]|uniref:UvrABC system protein A n=1 Tax=Lacunisphaera limnophila TaxID=1838286 RepID=A0A1D8AWB2_9BACT|nr:excinuclease ABC subunit UvrA [Lacunisphaera limnophila]AOS45171.1 UvrABC system protein A [Lacunisphaera limnophila]